MYVSEVNLSYSEWDSSCSKLAVWKTDMSSVLLLWVPSGINVKETPPGGYSSLLKIDIQISGMNCPETAFSFAKILQVESQQSSLLCGEGITGELANGRCCPLWQIFFVLRECYFTTCCVALNPTVNNLRAWTSWLFNTLSKHSREIVFSKVWEVWGTRSLVD